MILCRYFEIVALKTLENIQENICSSRLMKLHDYSLQPTTGLKPPLQILFWECLEGKCSKILITPKNICKTVTASIMQQACSLEFLASTKQTQEKSFLLEF